MNRKKIRLPLVLVVALVFVIPLVLAFLILAANQDGDLNRGNVSLVTLVYHEKTQEVKEKEEIAFFVSAATKGSPIEKAAHDLTSYRKVEVTYHKLNNDLAYTFYLSDSENDCVYTDPKGKLFLFPAQTAKELQSHPLLSEYGLSFASYPSLVMEQAGKWYDAKEVTGKWNYVRADGTFSEENVKVKQESVTVLPQGEKVNLKFGIDPDYCNVLLEDDEGNILYSGLYGEMPVLYLETDSSLSLTVSCDWYEGNHKDFHGSLKFIFDLFYDIPTHCEFQTTTARPGESFRFVLSHTSSPDIAVSATFPSGEIVTEKTEDGFAVTVPVSEAATPGEYSILILGSDADLSQEVILLPAE